MTLSLTPRAQNEANKLKLSPQLVLEIEGVSTLFGAVDISETVRIGDPGLKIGGGWKVGGLRLVVDQADVISFDGGTSTSISQQLQPDKGAVSSVSSIQVALNDRNLIATQLISPGFVIEDILGTKATLWMGFKDTAFKDDYIRVFAGIIDDVISASGQVVLNLAHPDQLKRQQLFTPVNVLLVGTIDELATTVPLADATGIYQPQNGPTGVPDPAIKYYVKIEDEVIEYTGVSGTNLTGCVRGSLATVPVKHTIYQVSNIVCFADIAGSLNNKHFEIHSALNAAKYYVWFNVAGAGVDPAIAGGTGVMISIATNADAPTIAAAVGSALGGLGPFTVAVSGTTVTATNTTYGQTSESTNGNSGFDVSTVDTGADPIAGTTIVSLQDTAMNCALKLMLSGTNGNYLEGLPVTRYLHPDGLTTVANSIFFDHVDLNRDYGVFAGDYVTITGATAGANNCATKAIREIVVTQFGSYAVIDGVSFVSELTTAAVVAFRSQYDSLGYGMGLTPDQVDVEEHIFWQDFLLADYFYKFIITDMIQGKDFLDQEVYLPIGAFSLPRKGRCSMGYHAGPMVRGEVKVLSRANIKNPQMIKLRRTINRNFYNTIVYQFDQQVDGSFVSGVITQDADSTNRIPVGNKVWPVASAGLRRELDGNGIAARVSTRYLNRYKFGCEFIEALGVLFRDGFNIECGDVVLFDPAGLKVSNTVDGTRDKPAKLFSVMNTKIDLKTGDVSFAITDTNFDGSERYGTISPSSLIVSGTTTSLIIEDSFGALYPDEESRKWVDYIGLPILVHSPDFSYAHEVILKGIDAGNSYKLLLDPTTPLPTAPAAGYVIDVADYPDSADASENSRYKAVHAFMSASVPVVSAADDTHLDVGANIDKFAVGSTVRVHDPIFDNDSGEVKVKAIAGTVIQTDQTMGFTPDNTCIAEQMDFPDGGKSYRIF